MSRLLDPATKQPIPCAYCGNPATAEQYAGRNKPPESVCLRHKGRRR